MLQRVLATAILLSSVSFGSLSDIPDIQDPEFSWKGLELKEASSTETSTLDFHGIQQRSLIAGVTHLDNLFANPTSENGGFTAKSFNEASTLLSTLHSETCAVHKLIGSDVVIKYATPGTRKAVWNLYHIRILLLQECLAKFNQVVKTHRPDHIRSFNDLVSPLSTSLENLMANDPTQILEQPYTF